MNYGLSEMTMNAILSIFLNFPEIDEAIIYGSRAKGNFKNASDIDLVFKGKELNTSVLNKIDLALDDLLLPYTFDLSIYHHIDNPQLVDHIDRVGKNIFKPAENARHTDIR